MEMTREEVAQEIKTENDIKEEPYFEIQIDNDFLNCQTEVEPPYDLFDEHKVPSGDQQSEHMRAAIRNQTWEHKAIKCEMNDDNLYIQRDPVFVDCKIEVDDLQINIAQPVKNNIEINDFSRSKTFQERQREQAEQLRKIWNLGGSDKKSEPPKIASPVQVERTSYVPPRPNGIIVPSPIEPPRVRGIIVPSPIERPRPNGIIVPSPIEPPRVPGIIVPSPIEHPRPNGIIVPSPIEPTKNDTENTDVNMEHMTSIHQDITDIKSEPSILDGEKHVKAVHSCELCEYKATFKWNLQTHIKSVHEGVRYSCKLCDYKATTKCGLKKHEESIHEGTFRYKCEQCEYKSSYISNLKQHVKSVHEGVKYNCELCDYKATQKFDLIKHVKSVHEGIKYSCEQCDYKATQKVKIQIHVKSVHEGVQYSCEHCDYKASLKRTLLRHVKSVHEGLKYSCKFCDYKPTRKETLQRHVRLVHEDPFMTKLHSNL